MFKRKTVGYLSEGDKFIKEFNQAHPMSMSQKEEVKKHQRVYQLRDKQVNEDTPSGIWEEF